MSRAAVFWPTFWLGLVLLLAKATYWGPPPLAPVELGDWLRNVAACSHADLAFAAGLGLVAWLSALATARRPRLQRLALRLFVLGCLAAVIYAVVSVQVFAYLRAPMTYSLWYLVGDLRSMHASLGSFVNPRLVAASLSAASLYLLALRACRDFWPWTLARAALGVLALSAWLVYGYRVNSGTFGDRIDHRIAQSPHWTILSSSLAALLGQGAPHFEPGTQAQDLLDFVPPRRPVLSLPASFGRAPKRPRNVILLVLESAGAEWMSLYGSRYPSTPRLEAEAAHALVFDNFYCHVGFSANSMAALSLSIFPYMTWREYTEEFPAFPGATVADLLKPRGYRTAFIHSGDLDYVGQGRFLAHRGFDVVRDLKDLAPQARLSDWGGDDHLLVDGMLAWLDQDRRRPFYLMAWGIENHFPYEANPAHKEIDFFHGDIPPDDWDLGRYLNTLDDVDGQIGRLIDGLRARGLADDTLLAITGDHGEGFGAPHYSWGHGDRLYQADVHVPFLLWNPRLFPKGSRSSLIGSHVDVAPTLANVLGLEADAAWQGRSMFDPDRPPRAYFYAARDGYLLGLREGNWKYIYDATHGRQELYDLARDPQEDANLAQSQPDRARRLQRRLAAWKDHVERTLPAAAR